MPKGGGSENMSAFTTLVPAEGEKGVMDFIMKTVEYAGGKTCPPIIVAGMCPKFPGMEIAVYNMCKGFFTHPLPQTCYKERAETIKK